MQYIDFLVDIFETPKYTEQQEYILFFIKFETIAMQSLTVILGDREYIDRWSEAAKIRLINYCMIVLLKAINAYKSPQIQCQQQPKLNSKEESVKVEASSSPSTVSRFGNNHIIYAEENSCNHSLAFAIITINELLRNDCKMRTFYRHHRHFKCLIVRLYKKYGAKSKTKFSLAYPGISYALNHLMRVLYLRTQDKPTSKRLHFDRTFIKY